MQYSVNYGFYLPSRDGDDIADINQISDNFKIIEENVPSKKDLSGALQQYVSGEAFMSEVSSIHTLLEHKVNTEDVDQTYSATSSNPQSGTAVAEALQQYVSGEAFMSEISSLQNSLSFKVNTEDIDQTYSSTSSNPQSGTAVAEAIAESKAYTDSKIGDIETLLGGI